MKKFFQLNKFKRLIILATTLVSAILVIVLGSTLYVSKNVNKSIEYGGGAQMKFSIKAQGNNANKIADDVAQSIYERYNPLGVSGLNAVAETNDGNGFVTVDVPGTLNTSEINKMARSIALKPQLVLSDFYGNPLFTEKGKLNPNLGNVDPKGWVSNGKIEDFYSFDEKKPRLLKTRVPIISGGATSRLKSNGSHYVEITLEQGASVEWTKATKYISSLPDGKKTVLAWLNPQVMISDLKNFYHGISSPSWSQIWNRAKNPQFGFGSLAYVFKDKKPTKTLRSNVINADDYLISAALVSKPLSGNKFVIEGGNFTAASATQLARRINYGVSNYTLKTIYKNIVAPEYGENSFNKAMIAGIIVFSLIAILLIVNYGLLGALSTISIALFIFMTLAMFTVMRGEYSPAAIAALIIGIGMSVDAVIITFERLKSEMFEGAKLKKAFLNSNKKSLSTIFDSNITTLIVATVLFYFGTRSIIGLSVTLILSIIFTLLIMVIFTRFTATLLVRSGAFTNNKWLVGLKPKFDKKTQNLINKGDFVKHGHWFVYGSFILSLMGIVFFAVFAGMNGVNKGFVLSQEFAGGTAITFKPDIGKFSPENLHNVKAYLNSLNIDASSLSISSDGTSMALNTSSVIDADSLVAPSGGWVSNLFNIKPDETSIAQTSTDVATRLVKDAAIAVGIAMGATIAYTFIRFKWNYSLAAIIAIMHDALIVLAFFAIFRIEISPIFIAALLSIIGYSINDTIVTFDRVREKMKNHFGDLNKANIIKIANESVRETFKRSFLTSFTTLLSIIILMMFGNATKFVFNIAMFVGLISGTYSSIFIATWLWVKLEVLRQKGIRRRAENKFWNVKGLEEQTIKGINDIRKS